MSCSVFLHIKYSKELEEKIRKISGVVPTQKYRDFDSIKVPENLFFQHKKDVDAHKWVENKNGDYGHFPQNISEDGKTWAYRSHGFEIWLNFEGNIVFIAECHWNAEHGDITIRDLEEWIKTNLGDIKIKEAHVS